MLCFLSMTSTEMHTGAFQNSSNTPDNLWTREPITATVYPDRVSARLAADQSFSVDLEEHLMKLLDRVDGRRKP